MKLNFSLFLLFVVYKAVALQHLKKQENQVLMNVTEVSKQETTTESQIDGSYRLRLPQVPVTVSKQAVAFSLCNSHRLKLEAQKNSSQIKISDGISTLKMCEDDEDDLYLNLLTSVTSYQEFRDWILLLKNDEPIAKLNRNRNSKDKGSWLLEIINVGVEVHNGTLSFSGCNQNNFKFTLGEEKSIKIQLAGSTRKMCNVDNDRFFIKALQKAVKYESNRLSFELFDKYENKVAFTTPYLL